MVLTAIQQYPNRAYAGLMPGLQRGDSVETFMNNAAIVAGVTDLVFVVANTHTYTATIYGIPVSFTSGGAATAANVRDGFIAAVQAIAALASLVTAAASGNNCRLTELQPDTAGSMGLAGFDADTSPSVVTAHSQTEPLPAGIFIAQGPNFQDLRLPRTSGDLIRGIVLHQHQPIHEKAYPAPSKVIYPPNSQVSVVKRGRIWCIVEEAVLLTDTPFFRFAPGAGGTQLGAVRKSADTATAATLSGKAQFRTAQATPGGLALVECNLVP